MKAISRREVCSSLTPIAATGTVRRSQGPPLSKSEKSQKTLSESEVWFPNQLPVTTASNGAKRWEILRGVLATGEAIAVHESQQPAGITPNPPHSIQHSELILVQEGTLLFEHDGRSEKVGPGGVIFVAFGTRHAARNVGDGSAKYLVIAIAGDSK